MNTIFFMKIFPFKFLNLDFLRKSKFYLKKYFCKYRSNRFLFKLTEQK